MFWKNFRNTISDTLNSLDKFEQPVQLNLKGSLTSSSTLGGVVSLVIMIFLGYQALVQTIDMFNRGSFQVVQTNEFQSDPDGISLNRENNFFVAILSRVGNNFLNMSEHSLISFKGITAQIRIAESGPVRLGYAQILWAPCKESDFPSSLHFDENIVEQYNLNVAYCASGLNFTDPDTGICPEYIQKDYPDCFTPPDFTIQGNAFSSSYEFIDLTVTLCNPADAVSISGLKCSANAVNETLAAGGVTVFLVFGNNYIDPNNHSTPNKTFLDFIDWSLHPQQTRTANVYVDKETIEDYDSYFLTDKYTQQNFYSISADKMREQQLTPRNYLLDATIRRSNLNRITTRTYLKIFDVFSSVGGLSGTLFLIGSIIALGYAQYKYFVVLSNEFYDFEKYEESASVKKLGFDIVENITLDKNNPQSAPPSSRRISAISPAQRKGSKINMNEYFDSIKAKKKLEYNEFTYIKSFFLKLIRKKNPNEQLAQKARKEVTKDLDITRIIQKLKEIDKIKMLIMNPSQLEAFNFAKKPVIIQESKSFKYFGSSTPPIPGDRLSIKSEGSDLVVLKRTNGPSKYEKLYAAYREIKEDKNSENTKINEKLLSMIDKEILNLFTQIDNQAQPVLRKNNFEQIIQDIEDKSMNIDVAEC